MIVEMTHLDVLCLAKDKQAAVEALRDMGVVHIEFRPAEGVAVKNAKGELASAETAVRAILKARGSKKPDSSTVAGVHEVLDMQKRLEDDTAALEDVRREVAEYAPYGDFDPALAKKLLDMGIELDKVADIPAVLPRKRLSALKYDLAALEASIEKSKGKIASCDEKAILSAYPGLADKIAFESAVESMREHGEIAVLSGWVPTKAGEKVRKSAEARGLGVFLRKPEDGECPPTLVEPPRFFKPMKSLFAGLGVSPAYTESDVSVPFMCYFTLFFAMLVGDGGYGALMFILTLWGWKKFRANPVARPWLVLMTVFSSATVAWGLLSNTWFGAAIPCCASWPTVKWLGDPSYRTMMFLCFTIGASHLILARLWNALSMANSITALGQIGWAGVLLCMYWTTCGIVGIFQGPMPPWFYPVFAVSIAMVFLFSVPFRELKTRGAELGMLPLNIMSALGDIISYVRLFAVGLASVQVAVNFNNMAFGLISPENALWKNALLSAGTVLILLVGHGLNFAMAGLSVLVHAVRLNTLEFSNHKGVSWSGYSFKAFEKNK